MTRLRIMVDLLAFFMHNKCWWLVPMLVVIALFGSLLLVTQNPVVAPFIYTLF